MKIENILGDGIGFIELVNSMGGDLTVANSARVSFGKRKIELDDGDRKLIAYLAKNKHWSPFRHVTLQFHIKAPEFVMRQAYKHCIGIHGTEPYIEKDHAWNEISGRYVVYDNEFYRPVKFRKQSESNKQASTDEEVDNPNRANFLYDQILDEAYKQYKLLLEAGVCKEQARGVLPVSFYTEVYWSASLQAVMNFIKLRDDNHAQFEIRQYSVAMKEMALSVAPLSVQALLETL